MDCKPLIALALLLPTCAWADHVKYPPRRPGLWEGTVKTSHSDGGAEAKYCIDATTGQQPTGLGRLPKLRKYSEKVDGNTVRSSGSAKFGKHIMTVESTLTYSGGAEEITGLTIAVHARFDPPLSEPIGGASDTTVEIHWTGDCPADMKPGDMIIDGKKRSITDRMAKSQRKDPQ